MKVTGWSEWHLAWFVAKHYGDQQPPSAPPEEAELSADGAWSTLYVRGVPVAIWSRGRSYSESDAAPQAEVAAQPKAPLES